MTQPLAILNAEELHWLGDLGLPNQRRWLNHRTLGDEHRRTFPSAATEYSISTRKHALREISHAKTQRAQRRKGNARELDPPLRLLCAFASLREKPATLTTTSRRRPARFRGWCGLSTAGQASPHTRRCARRVASQLVRACSLSGVAHLRCAGRRESPPSKNR